MTMITVRDKYRLKCMAKFCAGARKILDVGLFFPNYYISTYAHKKAEIVGLDIIKYPVPKGYGSVIKGDVEKLDSYFKAESFDIILLGELIEHVKNPYEVIKKCHHILKKNGKIVLSTPNPLGLPRVLFEYLSSKKYFYHRNHYFEFIPRWVEKIITNSGFQMIEKIGIAFLLPVKVPPILADQVIYIARKKT